MSFVTIDTVSTTFNVTPFDQTEPQLLVLPSHAPSLLQTVSKSAQNWSQAADSKKLPEHLLYLDQLGYIFSASEDRVQLSKELGYGNPNEFTFRDNVSCIGIMHHLRIDDILVVFSGNQLSAIVVRPTFSKDFEFMPVHVNGSELPTEITAIKCTKLGKAVLGGKNGNVYQLKIEMCGSIAEEGLQATIINLSREWNRLLAVQMPIRQIHIDLERDLAYAIHDTFEIEVYSLQESILSDKPYRVANYHPPSGVQLMSFAVLPKSGFGQAVFLGVSLRGDLYYFTLDQGCFAATELTAGSMRKRAKTWWGIGLRKNLSVCHLNSKAVEHFEEYVRQGGSIELAAVIKTTIYLTAYLPESGDSTLWEMKNGIGTLQTLQQIEDVSVRGKIAGMCTTEVNETEFSSHKHIRDRTLTDELTAQHFYEPAKITLYTKEQRQNLALQWPCQMLDSILESRSMKELSQFIDIYGASETAAMLLLLDLKAKGTAKRWIFKESSLIPSIHEGFVRLFKRIIAPVWLAEAFCCENRGSFLRPQSCMKVKISGTMLKTFKDMASRLEKSLRSFLNYARISVYQSGDVFVHSSSGIDREQAEEIVKFERVVEGFVQSMSLLGYLSQVDDLIISHNDQRDIAREISLMSIRDFVNFITYRRSELFEFCSTITSTMKDEDKHSLNTFFKKKAPLLDPFPSPRKEDALGMTLTPRLKELRREIRALNEQLSRFLDEKLESKEQKDLQLREHYGVIFDMIQRLAADLFESTNNDNDAIIEEILKFVKIIKEVEQDDIRHEILYAMILSPLGHKSIISKDNVFELVLKSVAQMEGRVRFFTELSEEQTKAINSLIGFYECNQRFEEAGDMHVVLATRLRLSSLEPFALEARQSHLRAAEELYLYSRQPKNISHLISYLDLQKEFATILKERLISYDLSEEDEQLLVWISSTIVSRLDLKVYARTFLADDDEETRAAFSKSEKFKSYEALVKAIE